MAGCSDRASELLSVELEHHTTKDTQTAVKWSERGGEPKERRRTGGEAEACLPIALGFLAFVPLSALPPHLVTLESVVC